MSRERFKTVSPQRRIFRRIPRHPGMGGGKLVDTSPVLAPPSPVRSQEAWNQWLLSVNIGSYSAEIDYWRDVYNDLAKERKEDPEEARKRYEDRHGSLVASAKKQRVPDLTAFRRELQSKNMTAWEAHYLGVVCLRGIQEKPSENETEGDKVLRERKEQEIKRSGIIFLKKANFIYPDDPFHPYGLRIELEKIMEKQRVKKEEKEAKEKEIISMAFAHHEGEEQFIPVYYSTQIEKWMRTYLQHVRGGALDNEIFKELHERYVASQEQELKETEAYFRRMLEAGDDLSAFTLYCLGLRALRNPFSNQARKSELVGFELIEKAYEKAGENPSYPANFKGFFAWAIIQEYIYKWMELRDEKKKKVESKNKIKNKVMAMWIRLLKVKEELEIESRKRPIEVKPDPNEIPF